MTKQRFFAAGRSGAWFEISPEQAERIRQAIKGDEWWQMSYAKPNPKTTVIFPAKSEQERRDIWRWRRYKARLDKGEVDHG